MAKTTFDAPRGTLFNMNPADLLIPEDKEHPLHDPYRNQSWTAKDEALCLNIMVYGLIQPIVVKPDGDRAIVVAGRRRTRCSREANVRLAKEGKEPIRVPCVIRRGEDKDLFGVMASENEQREDDGVEAKAWKAQRMLDFGKSEEEVCVTFGITGQTLKNWLDFLALAPEVRSAVREGAVSATAATALVSLPHAEQKTRLAEVLASGNKPTVGNVRRAAKGGTTQQTTGTRPSIADLRKLKAHLVPDSEAYYMLLVVLGEIPMNQLASKITFRKKAA